MVARATFNTKRRLAAGPSTPVALAALEEIAKKVRYVGSPLHKRSPANFGLDPPAAPRPGKTLCDDAVNCLQDAHNLLVAGVRRGLVSLQFRNGFPQNVWAVTENGIALESQLDNGVTGTYHGYPMTGADPLRDQILKRWAATP